MAGVLGILGATGGLSARAVWPCYALGVLWEPKRVTGRKSKVASRKRSIGLAVASFDLGLVSTSAVLLFEAEFLARAACRPVGYGPLSTGSQAASGTPAGKQASEVARPAEHLADGCA